MHLSLKCNVFLTLRDRACVSAAGVVNELAVSENTKN